jgi:hypothetical protein
VGGPAPAALVFGAVAEGGGPGLTEQRGTGNAHQAARESKDVSGVPTLART